MKVAAFWGGGKECCLAYYKATKQGHDVTFLLTWKYMEPYVFHSLPIMEMQSKAMRTPQVKVEIKNLKDPIQEMHDALARLKKETGIEGIVTGDITGVGCAQVHSAYYEPMCEDLGIKLVMPIVNPSGNTYDVLKEEISSGLHPIMNCVNSAFFSEEWLGRELNEESIKELKELTEKHDIGVCSEFGIGYHTMVLDAPFFKERLEISKFSKEVYHEKKRSWLYLNSKEVLLKPKK